MLRHLALTLKLILALFTFTVIASSNVSFAEENNAESSPAVSEDKSPSATEPDSAKNKEKAEKATVRKKPQKKAAEKPTSQNSTELVIKELKLGKGEVAKDGMKVKVHYTGWLTNGREFDSSLKRKEPFEFMLGAHQVIEGWDKGISGMKVGGKRRLTIPAKMGYGEHGAGDAIPPNSTLIFEVELLGVNS